MSTSTSASAADFQACQQACDVCAHTAATHWCEECEQALCETCRAAHASIKVTRTHPVSLLAAARAGVKEKERYCEVHKEEKLQFICSQCSRVVCRNCKQSSHEGHKTVDIGGTVSTEARELLVKVSDVAKNSLEPQLRLVLQEAETQKRQLLEKKPAIAADIDARAAEMKRAIDNYVLQAKDRLNQEADISECTNHMNQELEDFLILIDHAKNAAVSRYDADALDIAFKLQTFFGCKDMKKAADQVRMEPYTHLRLLSNEFPKSEDDSKLKSFTKDNWRKTLQLQNPPFQPVIGNFIGSVTTFDQSTTLNASHYVHLLISGREQRKSSTSEVLSTVGNIRSCLADWRAKLSQL